MAKKKTLPKLKKDLQKVFNEFIRKRDEGKPCISCNEHKSTIQAGHYWAVKIRDGLRFDEDNVHGECAGCNCFDPCHLITYTENLKARIGDKRYNDLTQRANDYKQYGYKWSRSELEEMIKEYKLKITEL